MSNEGESIPLDPARQNPASYPPHLREGFPESGTADFSRSVRVRSRKRRGTTAPFAPPPLAARTGMTEQVPAPMKQMPDPHVALRVAWPDGEPQIRQGALLPGAPLCDPRLRRSALRLSALAHVDVPHLAQRVLLPVTPGLHWQHIRHVDGRAHSALHESRGSAAPDGTVHAVMPLTNMSVPMQPGRAASSGVSRRQQGSHGCRVDYGALFRNPPPMAGGLSGQTTCVSIVNSSSRQTPGRQQLL